MSESEPRAARSEMSESERQLRRCGEGEPNVMCESNTYHGTLQRKGPVLGAWPAASFKMLIASLVMSLPRGCALFLIHKLLEQAQNPLAVDFATMWMPCSDPNVHFSSYGMDDGALYRWSIVTDHVLTGLGATLAFNGALNLVVQIDDKDRISSYFTIFLCVVQCASFVTLAWHDVSLHFFDLSSLALEKMKKSYAYMDRFDLGTTALFVFACLRGQCRIDPLARGYSMLRSDR